LGFFHHRNKKEGSMSSLTAKHNPPPSLREESFVSKEGLEVRAPRTMMKTIGMGRGRSVEPSGRPLRNKGLLLHTKKKALARGRKEFAFTMRKEGRRDA